MIRIKQKTELRQALKNAEGTTRIFDQVNFYHDGSWVIISSRNDVGGIAEISVKDMLFDEKMYFSGARIDKMITSAFADVEKKLNN